MVIKSNGKGGVTSDAVTAGSKPVAFKVVRDCNLGSQIFRKGRVYALPFREAVALRGTGLAVFVEHDGPVAEPDGPVAEPDGPVAEPETTKK